VEIQRLIGRVLRNCVDFRKLGPNTLYLDCDVLEADGSTRTAAVTGAYVAMSLAVRKGLRNGLCRPGTLKSAVAAVSVGIVDGRVLLDLNYPEDSNAEVDMNIAMTTGGRFVEVQGTSEQRPFNLKQLEAMLKLARRGIARLLRLQRSALKE
jgi:ribonuclease PH